jgi:outer membrane protein TolC
MEGTIPACLPSRLLERWPDIRVAQRQLFAAETELVSSIFERRLAYSRIYLALGGGWDDVLDG